MSVVRCGHCGVFYWRYWGDSPRHAPRGYCSTACWPDRRKKPLPLFSAPYSRACLLAHRAEVHGTDDVNSWFNCPGCDQIEAEYQRSITS